MRSWSIEQLPTHSPMPNAVTWTRSTPDVIAVKALMTDTTGAANLDISQPGILMTVRAPPDGQMEVVLHEMTELTSHTEPTVLLKSLHLYQGVATLSNGGLWVASVEAAGEDLRIGMPKVLFENHEVS